MVCLFLRGQSIEGSEENSKATQSTGSFFHYVINDFNFYSPQNIARPQKGVPFRDPIFHSTITRITDAKTEAHGQKYDYSFPGYPKHDIGNADDTLLLIQTFSGSTWNIWNAHLPYNKIREIPSSIIGWGRSLDARWDSHDPNVLYFYQDTRFFKYNVKSNHAIVLHNFKDDFPSEPLSSVTMLEEGTPSSDSRYWVFICIMHDPKHSPQ